MAKLEAWAHVPFASYLASWISHSYSASPLLTAIGSLAHTLLSQVAGGSLVGAVDAMLLDLGVSSMQVSDRGNCAHTRWLCSSNAYPLQAMLHAILPQVHVQHC